MNLKRIWGGTDVACIILKGLRKILSNPEKSISEMRFAPAFLEHRAGITFVGEFFLDNT